MFGKDQKPNNTCMLQIFLRRCRRIPRSCGNNSKSTEKKVSIYKYIPYNKMNQSFINNGVKDQVYEMCVKFKLLSTQVCHYSHV